MWFTKRRREKVIQDGYTVTVERIHFFITRGDSAYPTIDAKDRSGRVINPSELGTVRVQVRTREATVGELLFTGEVLQINGKTVWHIRPEDTRDLEYGTYKYDVQIEMENGDVKTFIPISDFVVMHESTRKEG